MSTITQHITAESVCTRNCEIKYLACRTIATRTVALRDQEAFVTEGAVTFVLTTFVRLHVL